MDQHDALVVSPADARALSGALHVLVAYLALRDTPQPADVIVGLGSDCRDVAERVAELFRMGLTSRIVFAGGRGRLTGALAGTEAGFFKGVAVQLGVPSGLILLEEESTNTLENIRSSAALLARHGITPGRVILVTQPVLQRRAWATARRQWPGVEFLNCPPDTCADVASASELMRLCDLAVGEMERLRRYAAKGDIEPQCIPAHVGRACQSILSFRSRLET